MHHRIDEGYPVSNDFSNLSLTTRKVDPFIRGVFDGSISNQLPAIKEEESVSEEEEDSEISPESTEDEEISSKLSSLNINCLMNVDVKQSGCIWNTNFGKRLINSSSSYGVLSGPDGIIGNSQPSQPILRAKFVRECHKQNDKNHKIQANYFGNSGEESKTVREESLEIIKKESTHEENSLEVIPKSIETFTKLSETVSVSETSTPTLSSKPVPLIECVKRICQENSPPFNCENCDETFSDVEELCYHQNQHRFHKETCLLCDEIFYNPREFAQHLLTHEGVDLFSCKKCMRYFPNLIKYKKHVQEFHYEPPPVVSYIRPPKLENVDKCYTKFECKRCKVELDSAKTYKAHKRAHLKKDLARAYFLSCHNI